MSAASVLGAAEQPVDVDALAVEESGKSEGQVPAVSPEQPLAAADAAGDSARSSEQSCKPPSKALPVRQAPWSCLWQQQKQLRSSLASQRVRCPQLPPMQQAPWSSLRQQRQRSSARCRWAPIWDRCWRC